MISKTYNDLKNYLNNYWPCIILALAFFGFISKALYNYPVGIMALVGIYIVISGPKLLLNDNTIKSFTLIFLCIWLPQVVSLFNAVDIKHSLHTVIPYLRFLFAGIFIITLIAKDQKRIDFVIKIIFFMVLFWSIDGAIQFFFKKDIFGYPWESGQITGMFYPRNTIAHICAILSPFVFLYIYDNLIQKKYLILSVIPLFFVVLISGRRAAWVMLVLTSLSFLAYGLIYFKDKKLFTKYICIITVLLSLIFGVMLNSHQPLKTRVNVTQGIFSGDYKAFNDATALRLSIWDTAYSIFKDNSAIGIGPRGFRHIYDEYAKPGDIFVETKLPPTQPHLLGLEILCETGVVGFIGYIFFITYLCIFIFKRRTKKYLVPYLIPVLVAVFPLNAHMAFYGSVWASVIWLLISLCYAKAALLNNYNNITKKVA